MILTHAVAVFFGGAFLANALMHLVAGLSGRRFPTPFAKPPFRGLSPPTVNVAYGLMNGVAAYALIVVAGGFELTHLAHAGVLAAGFGLAALGGAWRVGKMQIT